MLLTALNTLCFADVPPPERAAAATLSSVSMLLAQSLGIVVSTLILAAAAAEGGRVNRDASDFRIAFLCVGVLGLLSVAFFLRLSAGDGAAVSGRGVRTVS